MAFPERSDGSPRPSPDAQPLRDAEILLAAAQELSSARLLDDVAAAVRRAARPLSGADGVTFVLREGDTVRYAEEDSIAPLWKGRSFPVSACISGWAMEHRQAVVIEDVYRDDRIPQDLYRPTFVRSLAMVPVRPEAPVAAIGAYWARPHRADAREVRLLESLAGFASTALANVMLLAELRQAVRAREEFVAVASHELRTPLTPLRLQIEQLARGLDTGMEATALRTVAARVRGNVGRISTLVEDLLDLTRLRAGLLTLERAEVDLANVVRAAVERFGGELRVVADGPVPVVADPSRMQQVVENLVANALKFGGGRPVQIRVGSAERRARIEVRDEGIGVAEADHARIFEQFERAAPTQHFGGLGLGLWVVRHIVEAHGGRVDVTSRPGEGATFTVELELAA